MWPADQAGPPPRLAHRLGPNRRAKSSGARASYEEAIATALIGPSERATELEVSQRLARCDASLAVSPVPRAHTRGACSGWCGADPSMIREHGPMRSQMSPMPDRGFANLQQTIDDLRRQLAERTVERDEALARETATAEILIVINSSAGNLSPVWDAMLEKATRLCEAAAGILWIYDGARFRAIAQRGLPNKIVAELQTNPVPTASLQKIAAGENVVRDDDLRKNRGAERVVEEGGMRTGFLVALRKGETLLGAIRIHRREARPFSDKQIALVQNFAAQAVIAMENARLITETREALEQQTATAEVLGVINSSPADLGPVFDAMLEKAMRLREAAHGQLFTHDGEYFHPAAVQGEPRYVEWTWEIGPVRPSPNAPLGRISRGERIVHVADIREADVYRTDPRFREQAEVSGVRSQVTVALVKDAALLGAMTVYRREVRPFTEKQIALLQNFAEQAVVAMENARLLTETREALEQQTATAEVLQVINSSPGDLAPVFDAMLDTAMRRCGAAFGALMSYDGEQARAVSMRGFPPELAELYANPIVPRRDGDSPYARFLRGEPLLHIHDMAAKGVRASLASRPRALVELGGARTGLELPLRKDGALLGFMWLYRQEVRPFSDKQIALLQNFAAQAVIAMENARLLRILDALAGPLRRRWLIDSGN